MKRLWKVVALLGGVTIGGHLATSTALGYEEGAAGEAVVQGIISFKGTPPPPRLFTFGVHSRASFCSQFDNDGFGNRIHRDVTVNNGRLQDVVVYIRDITKGKQFTFNGTDVKVSGCRFLVQGGPSTLVGVVVNKAELRMLNDDADPSDPKAAMGVLHHPHAFEVSGSTSTTIFNLPLVEKGQVLKKPVILRKEDSVMKLENDSPGITWAWFLPVKNPYYAIVGPSGAYEIDGVPPGKYHLIAWHPTLGTQERDIEVGAEGTVTADLEFEARVPKSIHPSFPRDLVSTLQTGISLPDIKKMFGKPDRTEYAVCGPQSAQRQCYILVYSMQDENGNTLGDNRMYFDDKRDKLPTLDFWIINFVE